MVTPHGGAKVGSRGRRLVTAALGRPGHQPAGTMTGARGASLDVPHRLAGVPPREPRVSRSLAQVEPWDEILPQAEGRGGTPIGERALQSARLIERCGGYGSASFGVPLSFSSFLTFVIAALVAAIRFNRQSLGI